MGVITAREARGLPEGSMKALTAKLIRAGTRDEHGEAGVVGDVCGDPRWCC
jgi:hypothetical protein